MKFRGAFSALTGKGSPKSHLTPEFAVHVPENVLRLVTFEGKLQLKDDAKLLVIVYTIKASLPPHFILGFPLHGKLQFALPVFFASLAELPQ